MPRLRFRQRDELLDVLRRQRRVHHQHADLNAERRHRDEILQRVVWHFLVEMRIRDVGRRMDHDRISVGRTLGDVLRADQARCAAAVVDDELLAHRLGQFLRDDAPDDVVRSARRPRDHDAHGFDGVLLSRCQAACDR
jgi:hypothetical protein